MIRLLIALAYMTFGVAGFLQVQDMEGTQLVLSVCTGSTAGVGIGLILSLFLTNKRK